MGQQQWGRGWGGGGGREGTGRVELSIVNNRIALESTVHIILGQPTLLRGDIDKAGRRSC